LIHWSRWDCSSLFEEIRRKPLNARNYYRLHLLALSLRNPFESFGHPHIRTMWQQLATVLRQDFKSCSSARLWSPTFWHPHRSDVPWISPDLHPRKKADTATRLGRQEGPSKSASATSGGVRKPAASWRSVRKEAVTETRRTRGGKACAQLLNRWNEQNPSSRAEEYSQALADSHGCLQLESDLSLDVGC
jgi:hypothetical protein